MLTKKATITAMQNQASRKSVQEHECSVGHTTRVSSVLLVVALL